MHPTIDPVVAIYFVVVVVLVVDGVFLTGVDTVVAVVAALGFAAVWGAVCGLVVDTGVFIAALFTTGAGLVRAGTNLPLTTCCRWAGVTTPRCAGTLCVPGVTGVRA